ncbi:imidazole glycerol phosphate synthase, glutamine amidotransferase subunit [candidate division WOR-1 bacterium RIFOXYA12_FULL_43_27]|uniref:Imidazole glycerol phosphate synthase subunit HisH n=1 Tax=candidate division WOR-1 bacterium RIFOXYC2_FULL_46_14 TaxID=1802587 RepID=A0A1F4U3A7_UNCSA|nr:MAG: imidazole glycerol phosphate synthase, glutamine amidotransferase subunit [candidate division WOR-1 bacterium RIFOXYA12_FULL_43_27]OGC19091.1 MAG: imidazole glycerol phosphate synthase, glutamine amidotransferase subunit [candidate division WOR-1 bacterium RIFOXYB2_FULL_46_45]OGC30079.1 MAG: imidazole glycerol phosphate synthase, glutamine amidotransferase subunit [candidate division WOR-1 bacterium RIFOXYA2_FULL_46_56]OGC39320.1 MAG: imidazole glycerol phosphate synthase, glutamine amid
MIAIIDYGAGNLKSVEKALNELGIKAFVTSDKEEIKSANGVILPGVGSFDSAINELRQKGLEGVIIEAIGLKKPFLGICLGYQLLFESSEEGKEKGLGILKGNVKKIKEGIVPHMGWNRLIIKKKTPLLNGISSGAMVYFAHSYFPSPSDSAIIMTETDYGISFASSIVKDNLYGIQFHPEKSGEIGLEMLKNFGGLIKHV